MKTWIAVVVTAGAWGLTAGLMMPRGPLTGAQALWSVALSVMVGLLAGAAGGSRWVAVVAPATFWLVLELSRMGVRGPSVDVPHLSVFGATVFVTGRGVHAVLSAFPMTVSAIYGVSLRKMRRSAAQVRGGPARGRTVRLLRVLRHVLLASMALVLAAVAGVAATPGRTEPLPGGIAELTTVDSGAGRLGLMIRGAAPGLPVLLFVPGAPGGSEVGAVRKHLGALEASFIVATLERRGGGASYPALDPTGDYTLDRAVDDIGIVTDYLRGRFGKKVYLLGHSGGSILSVLAVRRHPELYQAYIGTGQAVAPRETDRITYDDMLAWGRRTGRTALVTQLTAQGPPPYQDVWSYEPIMRYQNQVYSQGGEVLVVDAPEYTLLQQVHTLTALLDTWSVLYPRMQAVDLRSDAPSLPVPVYFLQGDDEMRSLEGSFDEWYEHLTAPSKELVVVPGAGHRVMFERPDRLVTLLTGLLSEEGGR